jgi:hypothetical protein
MTGEEPKQPMCRGCVRQVLNLAGLALALPSRDLQIEVLPNRDLQIEVLPNRDLQIGVLPNRDLQIEVEAKSDIVHPLPKVDKQETRSCNCMMGLLHRQWRVGEGCYMACNIFKMKRARNGEVNPANFEIGLFYKHTSTSVLVRFKACKQG